MVDRRSQVPVGCTCMIEMQSESEGRLVNIADKDIQVPFVCEPITEEAKEFGFIAVSAEENCSG